MLVTIFLSYIVLGAFAGFCAGLLGVGGGLVIVPALLYLFVLNDISIALAMPMALATSLASISVSSASAAFIHHKNKNIPWAIAKVIVWLVAIGALLGALLANLLAVEVLTSFFACVVILIAAYMLFAINKTRSEKTPNQMTMSIVSFFTGIIASLMGIAGGAVLVPALSFLGMSLRQAIGLATICGVAIAFFGSIGFILTGWQEAQLPNYSLGYIYLPALFGIIISSPLFAKLGVRVAVKLPTKTLKKIFAIFLIIVAIKMLLT